MPQIKSVPSEREKQQNKKTEQIERIERATTGKACEQMNLDLVAAKQKLGPLISNWMSLDDNSSEWNTIREKYNLSVFELSALKNICSVTQQPPHYRRKNHQHLRDWLLLSKSFCALSNLNCPGVLFVFEKVDCSTHSGLMIPAANVVSLGLKPISPRFGGRRTISEGGNKITQLKFSPQVILTGNFSALGINESESTQVTTTVSVWCEESEYQNVVQNPQQSQPSLNDGGVCIGMDILDELGVRCINFLGKDVVEIEAEPLQYDE
jgi:hypothetical protein